MFDLPDPTEKRTTPASVAADDVQFARHDPALCAMPGLFRYVDEVSREDSSVGMKLTYTAGPLTIQVRSASVLGGDDLAVLQATVALSAIDGEVVSPLGHLGETQQALVTALIAPADDEHAEQDVVESVLQTAYSDSNMCEILGWPVCGASRARLEAARRNLASVVLLVYLTDTPKDWKRFHLTSTVRTNANSRKWVRTHVALNPRLTQIVLGAESRHTRVSLEETRALGTDQLARVLHQRLCAWINDGARGRVTYGTLLEYGWPADKATQTMDLERRERDRAFAKLSKSEVQQQRLQLVHRALKKVCSLPGWSAMLASDLPYVEDAALSDAENETARAAHAATAAASRRKAGKDVLDTVLSIQRGRLAGKLQRAA